MIDKLLIYNSDLELIGVLYTWISLAWNTSYNGAGGFTVELQQDAENVTLLRPWNFCTIDKSGDAMVITSVEANEGKVVASGFPAAYLLKSRVYGEIVSSVNAEQAMLDAVSSITDWPEIVVDEPKGLADFYDGETGPGSVYDCCYEIAQQTDIGFRLRIANGAFLFDCYKPGLNENAIFSERYGNLGNVSYAASVVDAANVAIVQGESASVVVGATETEGIQRHELYVDQTSVAQEEEETEEQYLARLIQLGVQALAEKAESEQVSFTVVADDVALGDVVAVLLKDLGFSLQVRLVEKMITSEQNRQTTEYTVGVPILRRKL